MYDSPRDPKRRRRSEKKIHIDSHDMYSMASGQWLSGNIIDACATIMERNWQNATFIGTELARDFFDPWERGEPSNDWMMFKLKLPNTGKIFFPFLKDGNH
ncbi:hypothetical protein QAD02_013607 [Eretmocerus hayati]|uniref:Uncharacterized protein n=1 Tax=Eretmocerus hayati TaxID=131215 RepID=A0ACC2P7S0_9HYME|nr:hypothetical protein QAD02_013607 [Eretmocerus hayati]